MKGRRRSRGDPDATMSFLEHLDELRARLVRCAVAFVVALAACWTWSGPLLRALLHPVQDRLPSGGIVFIHLTEPFTTYMKTAALAAVFVTAPFWLYQLWAFVAPGLYAHERRLVVPFLLFGTACFAGGGVFGYAVVTPLAADWLVRLGTDYQPALTLHSAFQFVSRLTLAMGAVFEMPVVIALLARAGLLTPAFLVRHFRVAVVVIAVAAAVLTPTGDLITMTVFGAPMVILYLIGVGVAWLFRRRALAAEPQSAPGR